MVMSRFRSIPAIAGSFRAGDSLCGDTGQAWPLRVVRLFTSLGSLCGTFRAGEQVAGDPGDVYELPRSLVFLEDNQTGRFRSVDRLLVDGEAVDGWQVDARDITVEGLVTSDDTEDQRTLLLEMARVAALPNLRLTVEEGPGATYLRLGRLKDLQRKHSELTGRELTDVRLRWRASDPAWYEARLHSIKFTVTTYSQALSLDPLTGLPAFPTVHIVAPPSGSLSTVSLGSTDGRGFSYTDASYLRNGASVIVDCEAGTVNRATGYNTLHYMVGTFPRLAAGTNVWQYAGGACTITLSWQPRWL